MGLWARPIESHCKCVRQSHPPSAAPRVRRGVTYAVAVALHFAVTVISQDGMWVTSVVYTHLGKTTTVPVQHGFTIAALSPSVLCPKREWKYTASKTTTTVLLKNYSYYPGVGLCLMLTPCQTFNVTFACFYRVCKYRVHLCCKGASISKTWLIFTIYIWHFRWL